MAVAVADAGPLHYLVLVGQLDLLPGLFGGVIVPAIVRDELLHPAAPVCVRDWAANTPPWVSVSPVRPQDESSLRHLDEGEAAAITLALSINADVVLMDDRAGVAAARAKGLTIIGTVGILDRAASRKLIDIAEVVARLKRTNFYYSPALLDTLVAQHRARDQAS